jgi:hypothetical protein
LGAYLWVKGRAKLPDFKRAWLQTAIFLMTPQFRRMRRNCGQSPPIFSLLPAPVLSSGARRVTVFALYPFELAPYYWTFPIAEKSSNSRVAAGGMGVAPCTATLKPPHLVGLT